MASVDPGEAPRNLDATAPMARRVASLDRGEQVGRYLVLHALGEGGMGIVYAAYDPQLDRRIALKVVRADHRSERGRSIARGRLAREAQALAKLSHRNVVTVYDVGSHDDDLFVAMELVDGETLGDWLLTPRPWPEVLDCLLDAGRGLAAAHDVGVVHRDFKPSNVLISRRGELRVTDFGLARLDTTTEMLSPADVDPSPRADELTKTGRVVGTPAYMAPEQHAGQPPDARADQYAFALTLYEAIYGVRPFGVLGGEALAAAKRLGVQRIPERDVSSRRVPRAIRRAIARALAAEPTQRFASMPQLLTALGRASRSRRHWVPVVAVLGVASFVFGLQHVHAGVDERCRGSDAKVGEVWGEAARTRLNDAFGDASTPVRAASRHAIVEGLDRYAEAWTGLHREACEATWHRGEQSTTALDERMACLDRRLDALRSTVEILRDGGAALLPRGVEIVLALPGVRGCSGEAVVDSEPHDGATAAEARTLRQRIDRVWAHSAASQYEHAVAEAQIVVEAARELGSEPLLAEALLAKAKVHDDLGEPEQAIEVLRDAAVAARGSGHARAEVQALIELGHVHGVRLREAARASFHLDQAETVLAAWGDAPELEARLALTRGRVAFVEGRDDDARVELELARDLQLLHAGADDPGLAAVQSQLAGVLLRRGDAQGAEALLEEALAVYERVYGSHHPRVAATLGNLGLVQADGGRFESAIDGMTRARQILEESFGADHPAVAMADDSLADVHRRAGKCDAAIEGFARAIAVFERDGIEGAQLGAPLLGLGRCELENDRAASALPVLTRAWEHAQREGVSPVQRGDTALALGTALVAMGDREAATRLLDQAETLLRDVLDPADDRWDELAAARR